MIETEGLGLSSFQLPVATIRDMALWTIEVHRAYRKKSRENYVKSCLADTNWWRRLFFLRPLTYDEMEARIIAEIRQGGTFTHPHICYPVGDDPSGDAIDISENLLKSCAEMTDGYVTVTVRDYSYLAVRPKRKA